MKRRATRRLRHAALLACLASSLAVPTVADALPPGSAGSEIKKAQRAITELRLADARKLVEPVADDHPQDPDVRYVQAQLRFHEGDYTSATHAIEASLDAAPSSGEDDPRQKLRELLEATHEATKNFVSTRSEDGRFVVRHAPGRDEVLVPYVFEALRRADAALTEVLGVRVPGPVRLEIYPTTQTLAEVSRLSADAIRRTGTIALCKWDRLMITSPRALVRGYPWMDTIAHEYVHLVLTRASNDKAPVWYQEGVAKFLERRWRGDSKRARLDPAAEGLLYDALRKGELIPFEKLHPSIALLPSQRDAALAFAQVATFFETFISAHGAEGLRAATERIAAGEDARQALAKVAGSSWEGLERQWKQHLRDRPGARGDAPRMLGMQFRQGGGESEESLDVEKKRARRYVRLGDLLWDRDRAEAAKVEYGKAHEAAPEDPIVSSRLARAALAAGDPERAIEAIDGVVERHPDHAPARAVMAAAQARKGNPQAARKAAREAIRLNPFNPRPHCVLAAVGEDDPVRRREERTCTRLGGTPADAPLP